MHIEQPRPLPRRPAGKGPLWQRLRDDLQARLRSGEFEGVFPGELALAEEYAVSRHTVREALRTLRGEGTVTAARGRTSRVAAPTAIEQPIGGALYSLFAAAEAAGLDQRSIVRTLDIRADGVVAPRLGLEESTPLLYLERVRLADGEPLAVDRVWLPAARAAPLLHIDFAHTSLYEQLDRLCGIRLSGGQERIRAVIPTAAETVLLDCPTGVAALAVDRLGCSSGSPMEWRHTLIRADRFSLTAQFAPGNYQFQPATTATANTPPLLQGALR